MPHKILNKKSVYNLTMNKTLLLSVLLFSTQAYSQEIKLPKLPKLPQISNPFKKTVGKSFSVKWSCPQEEYKEIAQLVPDAEVEVYINKKGEVSYRPNVFKVKPLSKEFVQGLNPLNLIKKNKATFKVDYIDCVNDFYGKIEKEYQSFKKNCEGDSSDICNLNSDEFMGRARNTVEQSRYMAVKENTVIIPKTLPGSETVQLSPESVISSLKDFCEMGSVKSKQELLSGSVHREIQKNASKYQTSFPGLDCMNKYEKLWKTEVEEVQKVHCIEGQMTPACTKINERNLATTALLNDSFDKVKKAVEREQKGFEYRYGGMGDEKAVDDHLKTKFKIPEGNCQYGNREMVNDKQLDLSRFDQEISNNLDSMFSEGSAECQRQFLQNYMTAKIQSGLDDEKFVEYCKLHQTEYCKKVQGSRDLVLSNIERMMKLVHGDIGERFYNEEVACHVEDENSIIDILGKIKDNEKGLRCKELENGDFKNFTWRQNPSVSSGDYTLKKVGDKKFEAYFNIDFSSNNGAKTTGQEMMNRAKECMATVSPYLKGPNGEELEIKLLDGDKELSELPLNQRPKKINIGIAPRGFRSHSKMYEENIDCPVITHEILHLFGLCDEYKEKWKGPGQNYDCRVVPTGPSVMKDQYEMFAIAVDKNYTCDCSSSVCQSVMNSNNPAKVNLYLGSSIYEITDYKERGDYCTYSYLPEVKYSDLTEETSKSLVVNTSATDKLVVINRGFDDQKIDRIYQTKVDCSCSPSDTACTDFLAKTKETIEKSTKATQGSCPPGSRTKEQGMGAKGSEPFSYDESSKMLVVNQKAKEPSLLYPSHFEKILGGTCEDKAKIYQECSKFAYSNGPCEVPDYCKDNSKYLGTKQ